MMGIKLSYDTWVCYYCFVISVSHINVLFEGERNVVMLFSIFDIHLRKCRFKYSLLSGGNHSRVGPSVLTSLSFILRVELDVNTWWYCINNCNCCVDITWVLSHHFSFFQPYQSEGFHSYSSESMSLFSSCEIKNDCLHL